MPLVTDPNLIEQLNRSISGAPSTPAGPAPAPMPAPGLVTDPGLIDALNRRSSEQAASPPEPAPPPQAPFPSEHLLDALRQRESGGNDKAVSPAGAQGPYQFMPATAADLGLKDPFDPVQSREAARRYLRQNYERFGRDPAAALAAYNWGPGAYERWKAAGRPAPGQPGGMPQETASYVDHLLPYAEPTPMAPQSSPNLDAAQQAMNLTPQERSLYETHLTNLRNAPVHNDNGTTSTLKQITFESDGRFFSVPTVWDGKIHKPKEAMERAVSTGLDQFPSYATEDEAQRRYDQMHAFMDRDIPKAGKPAGEQMSPFERVLTGALGVPAFLGAINVPRVVANKIEPPTAPAPGGPQVPLAGAAPGTRPTQAKDWSKIPNPVRAFVEGAQNGFGPTDQPMIPLPSPSSELIKQGEAFRRGDLTPGSPLDRMRRVANALVEGARKDVNVTFRGMQGAYELAGRLFGAGVTGGTQALHDVLLQAGFSETTANQIMHDANVAAYTLPFEPGLRAPGVAPEGVPAPREAPAPRVEPSAPTAPGTTPLSRAETMAAAESARRRFEPNPDAVFPGPGRPRPPEPVQPPAEAPVMRSEPAAVPEAPREAPRPPAGPEPAGTGMQFEVVPDQGGFDVVARAPDGQPSLLSHHDTEAEARAMASRAQDVLQRTPDLAARAAQIPPAARGPEIARQLDEAVQRAIQQGPEAAPAAEPLPPRERYPAGPGAMVEATAANEAKIIPAEAAPGAETPRPAGAPQPAMFPEATLPEPRREGETPAQAAERFVDRAASVIGRENRVSPKLLMDKLGVDRPTAINVLQKLAMQRRAGVIQSKGGDFRLSRAQGPQSLVGYLVKGGGLRDSGGELAGMDLRKGRPGLINNKVGRSLDDAALSAWEAGYFPEFSERPSINDLLEAIDEEVNRGRPRRTQGQEESAAASADRSRLEAAADQAGIDTTGLSDAEINDRLGVDYAAKQMGTDLRPDELIEATRKVQDGATYEEAIADVLDSNGLAWEAEQAQTAQAENRGGDWEIDLAATVEPKPPETRPPGEAPGGGPARTEPSAEVRGPPAVQEPAVDQQVVRPEEQADRPAPDQVAIDRTDQGDQRVLPGAEKDAAGSATAIKAAEQAKRADQERVRGAQPMMRRGGQTRVENDESGLFAPKTSDLFERSSKVIDEIQQDPIDVWHGSPHEFEAFDTSKIGTGEGAQSFGYGLYVAQRKGIAESYRRTLSYKETVRKFLDELPEDAEAADVMGLLGTGHFSPYEERVIRALADNDWLGFDHPSQAISAAYRDLKNFDPTPELRDAIEGAGHVYQVQLTAPDDAFLLWDKPLNEQSASVQKIMGEIGYGGAVKGEEAYRQMAAEAGYGNDMEAASKELLDAGIRGIKYADRGSRGKETGVRVNYPNGKSQVFRDQSEADSVVSDYLRNNPDGPAPKVEALAEPTYNYVAFDAKDLKITHRNGEPLKAKEKADVIDEMTGGTGEGEMHAGLPMGQRAFDRIQNSKLAQRLSPLGGLPAKDVYLADRYRTLGRIAKIDEAAKKIGNVFAKAGERDAEAVYDYLVTRGADTSGISDPGVAAAARAAKRTIESVGHALVGRGIISRETFEEMRGQYLPRVYLKHLLEQTSNLGGVRPKASTMGYRKARIDIPDYVREEILGEITDPAYLATRAIAVPARDIAILDFLDRISQNQEWVLPGSLIDFQGRRVTPFWLKAQAEQIRRQAPYYKPDIKTRALRRADRLDAIANPAIDAMNKDPATLTKDYKQVPDTVRYGRLRGMKVRKEIYDDIVGAQMMVNKDASGVEKLLGSGGLGTKLTQIWKMSKVSLNPPTQVRNFVSNGILLNLSGVPLHMVLPRVAEAIKEIRNDGQYWQIAKDYGVTKATFAANELYHFERAITSAAKDANPMTVLKDAAIAVSEKAGDIYQLSESLA